MRKDPQGLVPDGDRMEKRGIVAVGVTPKDEASNLQKKGEAVTVESLADDAFQRLQDAAQNAK